MLVKNGGPILVKTDTVAYLQFFEIHVFGFYGPRRLRESNDDIEIQRGALSIELDTLGCSWAGASFEDCESNRKASNSFAIGEYQILDKAS